MDIEDIYDNIKAKKGYENFPFHVVVCTFLFFYGGYIVTALIFNEFSPLYGILSIVFSVFVELFVMKWACVKCYYYGKWCARAGKGKLTSIFFQKYDLLRGKKASYKERESCRVRAWGIRKFDFKPMIMFFVPPVLAIFLGVYHIIFVSFSFYVVGLVLFMIVSFVLQGTIHEEFMCNMCKNRDYCPGLKAIQGNKKRE